MHHLPRHGKRHRDRPRHDPPLYRCQRVKYTLKTQETSKPALIHDKQVAKTLLDKFCSLAQTHFLGIIAHKKKTSIH
jgi:hypothetical protein